MTDGLLRLRGRLRRVIYDCDGVLIDSEGIAQRVCAAALTEAGWPMDVAECEARFRGMQLRAMRPVIEAHIGRPLPRAWSERLADRLSQAMAHEAQTIPGARAALEATTAAGLDWRIASNSGHAELRAKFAATGLTALVEGRVFSAEDVAQGKPAPDLFLLAAGDVAPNACIVVEDSVTGIQAAVAAGIAAVGFAPHHDMGLTHAGAEAIVASLDEFVAIVSTLAT